MYSAPWVPSLCKKLESLIQHLHDFGEWLHFESVESSILYVKSSILKYSVNNFKKLIQQFKEFFEKCWNNT